jgi:hypothetical protein
MQKVAIILVTVMLFGGSVFAASAFTTAELTRSANVNVVADNNGALSLSSGNVGNTAYINSAGELKLDASPSASGLNVEGQFTFGDTASPSTDYMFSMVNTTANDQTLTVDYNVTGDAQGQTDAMTFHVYDGTGAEVATVTNGSSATFTAGSGSTYYVVLETDTRGLDSSADLSGDLIINV